MAKTMKAAVARKVGAPRAPGAPIPAPGPAAASGTPRALRLPDAASGDRPAMIGPLPLRGFGPVASRTAGRVAADAAGLSAVRDHADRLLSRRGADRGVFGCGGDWG